ncbi:MAG: alpha/beta fold hydrolase [Flavobacteriales bacterium]
MAKKHLLLIHGFLENAAMWQPITSRISAKNYKILTPELAGHGKRTMINGKITIAKFAADIYEQLNWKKGDRAIVIGHSMGGYVAIELCKLLGEDVSASCLFHSTAMTDSEVKRADRQRAIDAAVANQSLYIRTVITSLFAEKKRVKLREQIEQNIADANAMKLDAITASISAMRERETQIEFLQQRHFPLYYFLGTEDARLPLQDMKTELDMLKGAVSEIAEKTGHMGHFECPQQAADFIQRIIRADM